MTSPGQSKAERTTCYRPI